MILSARDDYLSDQPFQWGMDCGNDYAAYMLGRLRNCRKISDTDRCAIYFSAVPKDTR